MPSEAPIDRRSGEMLLRCPRCDTYMKKLVKQNVVIDVCKRCGGMWADAGEIDKLAAIGK